MVGCTTQRKKYVPARAGRPRSRPRRTPVTRSPVNSGVRLSSGSSKISTLCWCSRPGCRTERERLPGRDGQRGGFERAMAAASVTTGLLATARLLLGPPTTASATPAGEHGDAGRHAEHRPEGRGAHLLAARPRRGRHHDARRDDDRGHASPRRREREQDPREPEQDRARSRRGSRAGAGSASPGGRGAPASSRHLRPQVALDVPKREGVPARRAPRGVPPEEDHRDERPTG